MMECGILKVTVTITTPPGQAKKSEAFLRKMLLGLFRKPVATDINKDDSVVTWTTECEISQALKLQRNAAMFQVIATKTIGSWPVRQYIRKEAAKQKGDTNVLTKELTEMFTNTKIEIKKEF
jgi:hypothetical protein